MIRQAPDVVIIGGGVIGSAIALRLAQEDLNVTVLDQTEPGREASSVAAGILSPQAESNGPTPFFQLADASRAIYPTFAEELRETTGMDVELRLDGVVAVAENETKDQELAARFQWQSDAGLAVEKLNAKELMELEPSLRSGLRGGIFFPNDGQVVGPRVTEAVIRAAARAGARFDSGNPARRILHEKGRVTGVESVNGVLACTHAVNAAGAWASFDSTLPFAVPIRPARGDIVALRGKPAPQHVVYSHELYVVPRRDGRILLGATMEFAGFDRTVKAAGVHKLMTGCFELLPDLEGAEFDTAWAGLRPCAPDNLPILGTTRIEGLHVATGHCRNGILLAPITARVAADIITKGTSEFDLAPFSVLRFENT